MKTESSFFSYIQKTSLLALISVVITTFAIFCIKGDLLRIFPLLFINNPLTLSWNIFFYGVSSALAIKSIIPPIVRFIDGGRSDFGGKASEYFENESSFLHSNSRYIILRIVVLISLSIAIYSIRFSSSSAIRLFSPSYSDIYVPHELMIFPITKWLFSNQLLSIRIALEFFFIFYVVFFIESYTNSVKRVYKFLLKYKIKNYWKRRLPDSLYNPNSNKLALDLMTKFVDEQGNNSIKVSSFEKKVLLDENNLQANTIIIGPTGAGKTTSFIVKILFQCLSWKAWSKHHKASVLITDPKQDLADEAIKIAKKVGRNDDILTLSDESLLNANPLLLKEMWDGSANWKIASWLVNAWINFEGKEPGDPYWKSQNYLLIGNLVMLMLFEDNDTVSIDSISRNIQLSSKGCFKKDHKAREVINNFGRRVLIAKGATTDDFEEFKYELKEYQFDRLPENLIDDEFKNYCKQYRTTEKEAYISKRKSYHEKYDSDILQMQCLADSSDNAQDLELAKKKISQRIDFLVQKDLDEHEEFSENPNKTSDDIENADLIRIYLIRESEKKRKELQERFETSTTYEQAKQLMITATSFFMTVWSVNNEENRGSIMSTMMPFFSQFQMPTIKNALSSSTPAIDFDEMITKGKILIPLFPAQKHGSQMSNAIITIIKARWQNAVLKNCDPKSQDNRYQIHIGDEFQKNICIGAGKNVDGDFDYAEVGRAYGAINFWASQSDSALEAKAANRVDWDKVHGVVRSLYCFGTNDPKTINFLKLATGRKKVLKISETVNEAIVASKKDPITERYRGKNTGMQVAITKSQEKDDVLDSSDIQQSEKFTGIALCLQPSIGDGNTQVMKFVSRPQYWPKQRDSWKMMKHYKFKANLRTMPRPLYAVRNFLKSFTFSTENYL